MFQRRLTVPVLPQGIRLAAVVFVGGAIFFVSVMDPPISGPIPVYLGVAQDKWLHGFAYAGFASTLAYARLPNRGVINCRTIVAAFAVSVAYGMGIELVQYPLAERAFDLTDAVANLVGAAAGSLPWLVVRGR